MAHDVSVRFRAASEVTCPLVQHHLRRRIPPEERYEFDEGRIRSRVEEVVQAFRGWPRRQQLDIVETYSGNRYFAAIELGDSKSVVLDYGFVELLADNIAMEYSDFHGEQALRDWFAAGQPAGGLRDNPIGRVEIDGESQVITGSMLLRDVACKFLEDIVPDPARRRRLMAKLLWRTDGERRPGAPYFSHLRGLSPPMDMMPPFVDQPESTAFFIDQIALATAFVTCHEISHLVFSDEDQASLRASRMMQSAAQMFESLCAWTIADENGDYRLGDLTRLLMSREAARARVYREAMVDIRAIDMLIEHERQQGGPRLERWSTWLANLFGLISMTNSLGIFRSHLDASIRERTVSGPDIHMARSEAVTRNLIVLGYLLHRNRHLAGAALEEQLIRRIHVESLALGRRAVYFELDLVAGVGEAHWKDFIDSALA